MEQIKIGASLSKKEKQNVYLAVAAGCCESLDSYIPGPKHQKQKRVLRDLRRWILHDITHKIPPVADRNMQVFKDAIQASEKVLIDITKENYDQRFHIMLNLIGFCLDELPATDRVWKIYNSLFGMWEEAYRYKDVRSGERIFQRIESELAIQIAQRGGIIR